LHCFEDGGRVLIATSHKPLQDQIANKDLPALAKLFSKAEYPKLKWSTLKGINNYFCWQSADTLQYKAGDNALTDRVIAHVLTEDEDFSGDFEDLPFDVSPDTRSALSADSEDCLGRRCPHWERCFALRARQKAETADIVVTNHALLTLDIKSEGAIIPGKYATYIIDEGHNFEDNATRANGMIVTMGGVRRFLGSEQVREAAKTNSYRVEEARNHFDRLQGEVVRLWQANTQNGEPDGDRITFTTEIVGGRQLAESLKEVVMLVKNRTPGSEEEGAKTQRLLKQGTGLIERLEKICAIADPNLVHYAERMTFGQNRNASYSINAMPVDVSSYLEKWFEDNSVIVTSATMSDGQSFDFFNKRVGIKQTESLIVASPFDYKNRVRLFLPKLGQPKPKQGQTPAGAFYDALAGQMKTLLDITPGRALVLFTSYVALENVWRRLTGEGELALPKERKVYKQGQTQMSRIIRDFQTTANGVIFGTRSWWQGVDLPGMRMLLIDKLPFPQLGDPIIKARIDAIDKAGGDSFNEFMLPMGIITFRQGFGRLMRQESDYGVVVVCDERVVQKSYGQKFLKSLATSQYLQNLDQIKSFYADFTS
jgi:ATP-dependent DNA helicase DinG